MSFSVVADYFSGVLSSLLYTGKFTIDSLAWKSCKILLNICFKCTTKGFSTILYIRCWVVWLYGLVLLTHWFVSHECELLASMLAYGCFVTKIIMTGILITHIFYLVFVAFIDRLWQWYILRGVNNEKRMVIKK